MTSLDMVRANDMERMVRELTPHLKKDDKDWTVLHWAARMGRSDLVEYLIDRGVEDVDGRDHYCMQTPLHLATIYHHMETVRVLVTKGGAKLEVDDYVEHTPLHYAVTLKDPNIMCFLLDQGANVDARCYDDSTVLHLAVDLNYESVDTVRRLIEGGVDVNVKNTRGETALQIACERGFVDIVRLLIDHGATMEASGKTPLHIASNHGDLELTRLLLERGAVVNAEEEGTTPLHYAAHEDHFEVCRALVDAGADLDALDEEGYTPRDDASAKEIQDLFKGVKTTKEHRRWLWERRKVNLHNWRLLTRMIKILKPWYERAQERAYAPDGIGYREVESEFYAHAKRQRIA